MILHQQGPKECFRQTVHFIPLRIKAILKENEGQPGTWKVSLVKWPVSVHLRHHKNILRKLN